MPYRTELYQERMLLYNGILIGMNGMPYPTIRGTHTCPVLHLSMAGLEFLTSENSVLEVWNLGSIRKSGTLCGTMEPCFCTNSCVYDEDYYCSTVSNLGIGSDCMSTQQLMKVATIIASME